MPLGWRRGEDRIVRSESLALQRRQFGLKHLVEEAEIVVAARELVGGAAFIGSVGEVRQDRNAVLGPTRKVLMCQNDGVLAAPSGGRGDAQIPLDLVPVTMSQIGIEDVKSHKVHHLWRRLFARGRLASLQFPLAGVLQGWNGVSPSSSQWAKPLVRQNCSTSARFENRLAISDGFCLTTALSNFAALGSAPRYRIRFDRNPRSLISS